MFDMKLFLVILLTAAGVSGCGTHKKVHVVNPGCTTNAQQITVCIQ